MKLILSVLSVMFLASCSSGGSVKKVGQNVIICDSNNECRIERIEKGDK